MCYLRPSSFVAIIVCVTLFTTVAQASLHERLHQLTMRYLGENVSDHQSINAIREKFGEAAEQVKDLVHEKPQTALAMSARVFPEAYLSSEILKPMEYPEIEMVRRAAVSMCQLKALDALYPMQSNDGIKGSVGAVDRFEDDMKAALHLTNHLAEQFFETGESNEAAFEVVKTACHTFKEMAAAMKILAEPIFNEYFDMILLAVLNHEDTLEQKRQRLRSIEKQRGLRRRDAVRNANLPPPFNDYQVVVQKIMGDFYHVNGPAVPKMKASLRVRKDHRRHPQ